MNNTPQTDAAVEATILQDRNHPRIDWVPASFARELERERDEAREAAHSFRSSYYAKSGINKGGCAFPWEGDEAREKIARQAERLRYLEGNKMKYTPQIIELADGTKCAALEDFRRERDEARFLLKAAQSALDAIHLEVGGWIKTMKENTD